LIERVQELAQNGDVEQAWDLLKELMHHEPNNPQYLIAANYCMQKAGNWATAYHFAKASVQYLPSNPVPYINLAAACDQMFRLEEGIKACDKAYSLAKDKNLKALALMNKSSIYINHGMYKKAESIAQEVVKINPTNKALGNLGMAQLGCGNWQGWKNYAKCLGTNERAKIDYGLPDWDGELGTVIVHGEQGLGDEISFASMINDIPNKVVIDCDYRLKGLFQRSFPNAYVHGGRWAEKYKGKADYQCAIGDLGLFYRNDDKDFPRTSYLKADPLRASQWKYLKKSLGKPLIGIAWTGGMAHTASKFRQFTDEQLKHITNSIDAHFVSLEYKPREPIDNIHVYPHATLTDDYDDTAALVSECDLVITIQTAVAHLAGALGVPCHVFVPETSQWRYGSDKFLWYTDNFIVHKAPFNLESIDFADNIGKLQETTRKVA
jgi:tetratricopeptide (TPR) repeat protein